MLIELKKYIPSLTSNRSSLSCSKTGPPVLTGFIVTVVKVIQVSNVALFHAHQTGQTLHVLISAERRKLDVWQCPKYVSIGLKKTILVQFLEYKDVVVLTYVAFPSLRKTQDRSSFSVASTTLAESGLSLSVTSYRADVGLANFFILTSAEASTFLWPFVSYQFKPKQYEIIIGMNQDQLSSQFVTSLIETATGETGDSHFR